MRTVLGRHIAAGAVALAMLLSACGSIRVEAGATFDPAMLESALRPGVSTQADVLSALGPPYGKGGALLPFHDVPRMTWTYFHEVGDIDLGKGDLRDQRIYLFVFFAGERYDSYLWFTSALQPTKP